MKQSELRPCAFCGLGVCHSNQILCTRIRVTRMAANIAAIKRQAGLEQMLGGREGSARLAMIIGPDEDMLRELGPTSDILVCDACAIERRIFEAHDLKISEPETRKGTGPNAVATEHHADCQPKE